VTHLPGGGGYGGAGYGGPNPVGPVDPTEATRMAPRPRQGQWQQPVPATQPWSAPPGPQPWQPTPQGLGPSPIPGAGFAAPPPTYGPGGPGLFGPPPRRNRKPLFVTLGAGAAVLIVVVIVLVITLAGGNTSGGGGSAADAVKGYLDALSRGDAEAALSYSDDQPASKDFLTSDILKKQIAKWPITNIRILSDDSGAGSLGMGQVHVAANFGTKVSDATVSVKRNNKRWYLASAAIKLRPTPGVAVNGADKTLTFFNKPVGDDTTYVFPGYVDIGSNDPYLGVKAKPLLLDSLTSYTPWVHAEFSLNDAGSKAVTDALVSGFAACQKSSLLKPPAPCPLEGLDPVNYVEGTARWGQADVSQLKVQGLDEYHLKVAFFGQAVVPVTVQAKSGSTRDGTINLFLNGNADISKVPPALSYR
jgi:hypothetical protein